MFKLRGLDFRCSHIYKEGNGVPDCLAGMGERLVEQQWWTNAPPPVSSFVGHDMAFKPYYRLNLRGPLGNQTSIFVELSAVIFAINYAVERDWRKLWLECDSLFILLTIKNPRMVPWHLRVAWQNCMFKLRGLDFRCSHIYKEGNGVPDCLAGMGERLVEQQWWTNAPPPGF
ncbi:hypothetical protein BVC80_49g27 [Macleaya cordata]|uniref:RNase H type-1 domain-containing protein n=1 Tax=Macleaya cordata TaxID=56857 RepID=A0A200QMU3_MACCD|nr:hypothetical protein BVC80_49g27 [Macleaya cordata]